MTGDGFDWFNSVMQVLVRLPQAETLPAQIASAGLANPTAVALVPFVREFRNPGRDDAFLLEGGSLAELSPLRASIESTAAAPTEYRIGESNDPV